MFRFPPDRLPVLFILLFSLLDFIVYFMVDNILWLLCSLLVMIIPRGAICAWNHHHQHTLTFFSKPLNRLLEFFYGLHTGATTNLWVLHHVLGHHQNFLNQSKDESAWKRADGAQMGEIEYALVTAGTAYFRAFRVGEKFTRVRREFVIYAVLTVLALALLCWFRLAPALLVFVFPMIISLIITAWVTYDHHAGLDTQDQFQASFNNTNRIANLLTGNLGYHTAHHYRQGVHWSKLPELHKEIKEKIPAALMKDTMFALRT